MARNPEFKFRPWPAPCLHCGKKARQYKLDPGKATWYCSDKCKGNAHRHKEDAEARGYANAVRALLGMPDDGCRYFTLPELRMMQRRIERLLPFGAMAKTTNPRRRRSA